MSDATTEPIPRVRALEPRTFEAEYVRRSRPVIIEGLVDHWPARRWNFSSFAERWSNRSVTVEEFASGDRFDAPSRREYKLNVAEFVRRLALGKPSPTRPPPALFCIVRQELPEVLSELHPPGILGGARHIDYNLVAGRDSIVFGHYHLGLHALLCQIHGTKRVVLCRPEDSPHVYPYPLYGGLFSTSRVDFLEPDFRRFPQFRAARPIEIVMQPGDALFIPVHWWHATYGVDLSMTASLFWKARWREHRFPRPGVRNLVAGTITWPRVRLLRATRGIRRWYGG